ncbi:MAG: hypothetical protein H7301_06355 [Cryobacterium sp.]|nr:hypothetical protein [Oligoflexia bacterium]
MKFAFLLLFALAPSLSQALVIEVASCETSDHAYQVNVSDNQGTGMDRTSHLSAQILDANGNTIASLPVELYQGATSASFGRATYQDSETSGTKFSLQGPSTNFKNYLLNVDMDGNQISDQDLSCTVFGGRVL